MSESNINIETVMLSLQQNTLLMSKLQNMQKKDTTWWNLVGNLYKERRLLIDQIFLYHINNTKIK